MTTLSEQLNKTDEINLVLWGKQDSVKVCKTTYPSQYSNVVANLSHHMQVDIHDGYLVLSRKG